MDILTQDTRVSPCQTLFVDPFMTIADIIVFSVTIRCLSRDKMEKKQGQVPGVIAYLVKTLYE